MRAALVTGSAGFIGFHVCHHLLSLGYNVVGVDALTDYYDVTLKDRRHEILLANAHFRAETSRIEQPDVLKNLLSLERPEVVIHLAAQAGVRYSIDAPRSYLESNITGTFELLEAARAFPPKHLLIASTSSAYGANTTFPYRETDQADHQMSFYAATKKACEAMSHSYSHLYDLPITLFRFFTVYGPWGRPDMALFKFTKAILNGDPIDVYNHGNMQRDFTYIDDLAGAICRLIDTPPKRPKPGAMASDNDSVSPVAPWRIVNIGNSKPIALIAFIEAIEAATSKPAKKNLLPMQPGDVPATWADTTLLDRLIGPHQGIDIQTGVNRFVDWYRGYYGV